MDVAKAQVTNLGDEVFMIDPAWPWTVQVRIGDHEGKAVVTRIVVESRQTQGITSTALSQIPVRHIAQVSASLLAGEGEAQYRMLASPRPRGRRGWPVDHFERVGRVVSWAKATGRSPAGTVAEFWNVHYRTARRWISRLPQA